MTFKEVGQRKQQPELLLHSEPGISAHFSDHLCKQRVVEISRELEKRL